MPIRPLVQPETVTRTGHVMIRVTEWGRPGPAAPLSLDQRPGYSHPDFARVQDCHLNVPGPPPAARAFRGLPDRWAPSPVVVCASAGP